MIKVNKLENIFWTNGSFEKPNTIPEITEFTEISNVLVDWNDNKTVGAVILEGDWNYAWCEDQWYFLKRLKVADREGAWFYGLVKDWWMNFIEKEVSVKGYCTKTTDKELLLKNLDYVEPTLSNPCRLYRLNLSDDISRHWWEDLEEIKKPSLHADFFNISTISQKKWYEFFLKIRSSGISDDLALSLQNNKEARYKKGVVVIGELKGERIEAHWKKKVYDKIQPFLNKEQLKNYVLTKVTNLGQSTVKNLYALTLNNKAIGDFEETARVVRLNFSGLFDIVPRSSVRLPTHQEFQHQLFDLQELERSYGREVSSEFLKNVKRYWVLQRKVYLPYLRKNWATNDDFLYRTHLEPTEISSARGQDTTAVSSYAEADPLVPVYQGWFAQGLKSKSKAQNNFYLPYINQLDTALNYYITSSKTEQRQTSFNNKIEWFNEDHPPEFGFLIFGEKRNRKDWTWWHYTGEKQNEIEVIVGLREGWEISGNTEYDREASKWVERVSRWWSNFRLLNSLYPYSWLYYFTAIKDNKVEISYHDWDKWGGTTGFFGTRPNQQGALDLTQFDTKNYIQRDIDNNVIDLAKFDDLRESFFKKKALTEKFQLYQPIEKDDIFFSDLTAFWEEYKTVTSNYKYATESGWYLDVSKNHRQLISDWQRTQTGPKLIFYWNNNLKRYQLGIYYIYQQEHQLAKRDNDIERVKFRENNANTERNLESAPDGVQSKTVLYHHIKPIRNRDDAETRSRISGSENLEAFVDFCKQNKNQQLLELDGYLAVCNEYWASGSNSYTSQFQLDYGVGGKERLYSLPKKGLEYDYEKIWEMLQVEDLWEEGGAYYKTDSYTYQVHAYNTVGVQGKLGFAIKSFITGITAGYAYQDQQGRLYDVDFLKFKDGRFVLIHSLEGPTVRRIRDLARQLRLIADWTKITGNVYTFESIANFIHSLNRASVQKDIYKQLGLLNDKGQILSDDLDIKEKLFSLEGTGYFVWIDAEEDAHLIFDSQKAKSDILLEEEKVFRLPHSEVPSQDYIDAINQQTSLQIATASYPIQERLLFKEQGSQIAKIDEDEYAENSFRLNIHRFSVEGKQNPNDYYIIEYQGARQLLDVKLGIPKRAVKQSRDTDVVAMAQLAFDREKWREEYKNKQSIWEFEKERQLKEFEFRKQHLNVQRESALLSAGLGVVGGGFGIAGSVVGGLMDVAANLHGQSELNSHLRADKLTAGHFKTQAFQHNQKLFNTYIRGAGAVTSTVGSLMTGVNQFRELNIQSRELEADLRNALNIFNVEANQLQTEHVYNERSFALKLAKIGNVFEQGEVNDRDVVDQYNDKKGLKEVHLIYKVPSTVQREGLSRYYELYGVNCQIPDVEFKFTRVLRVGEIWAFSFINEINNLWAFEEKEILKTIFANGFKILSLRKVNKLVPVPLLKPWQSKADDVLREATPEQKTILLNKLSVGLDQMQLIQHLAENVVDRNQLVPLIIPLLNKESLLAKLLESDDKDLKTKFVLKLLTSIDEDKIFEEILRHKDKEKLVEKWIEGGSNLLRTLWDKYPDHTVAKEVYVEELAKKDETITEYRQELQESHTRALSLQENIGNISENLHNTQSQLQTTRGELDKVKSNFEKSRKRVQDLTKRNTELDRENRQFKIEKIDWTSKNRQLEADKTKAEQATALQVAETLKVQTELRNTKEELDAKKKELERLESIESQLNSQKEELQRLKNIEEEKNQLTTQYDAKLKEAEEAKKNLEECQKSLEAVRQLERFEEGKGTDMARYLDGLTYNLQDVMGRRLFYSRTFNQITDRMAIVHPSSTGAVCISEVQLAYVVLKKAPTLNWGYLPVLLYTGEHNGLVKSEYYGFFALNKNSMTRTYWGYSYRQYLTKRLDTWEEIKTHILGYYGKEKAYSVCIKYSYTFTDEPLPEFVNKDFSIIVGARGSVSADPEWKVSHVIYWDSTEGRTIGNFTWKSHKDDGTPNKEIKTFRDYATALLGFDPWEEEIKWPKA